MTKSELGLWRHQRRWSADADSGEVFAIGNGQTLAYGRGPDLFQIQGPPYTAPQIGSLTIADRTLTSISSRQSGRAIWRHEIFAGQTAIGEVCDFVDAVLPVMVRKLTLYRPVEFIVKLPFGRAQTGSTGTIRSMIPAGAPVYRQFHTTSKRTMAMTLTLGDVTLVGQGGDTWLARCPAGESAIIFVGGPEYPECQDHVDAAISCGISVMLARTQQWWDSVRSTPSSAAISTDLAGVIDDVFVACKAQQAREGCVVAGYPFVLGYVRDQYGVSRAMIETGHLAEARQILSYYWSVWKHSGMIRNAQAAGIHDVFHRHENDDVEITGYLVIQAFDYLYASNDRDFVRELSPMLRWAIDAQIRHLVADMLPFNGDETYLAGGILPRSILRDGSAEATLLFIEGLRRFCQWDGCTQVQRTEYGRILSQVKDAYRANFWRDGKLMANNPHRALKAEKPAFRHGVCLGKRYHDGCIHFGWTRLAADGRYLCPICHDLCSPEPVEASHCFLPSIAVTPLLIDSDMFTPQELAPMVHSVAREMLQRAEDSLLPGYETGLLLYAMTRTADPLLPRMRERCLAMRDATGVWAEYYRGLLPSHTRYRPWESSLNLVALLASGDKRIA